MYTRKYSEPCIKWSSRLTELSDDQLQVLTVLTPVSSSLCPLVMRRATKLLIAVTVVTTMIVTRLILVMRSAGPGYEDFQGNALQNRLRRIYDRPLQAEEVSSEKWIVTTTISPPTDDVKFISSLPGWRVVVVGDVKTPENWSYPNCDFLSLKRQKELNYLTTELIPEKSYARKNIGYLYAIQHGAKVIYETDDDNRPLDNLERFDYGPQFSGLEFAGRDVFNPYHHFGQSSLWPRGFPLSAISQESSRFYRMSETLQTPLIQQGLVNGDPDMDAIFRLTRKRADVDLDVHFDPTAPSVVVPAGVFSPFNSQNTLFHLGAFWGLLLPTSTTMRVCDIWRGYWAQRLLWDIGGRLGFYPPNAYQRRNYHSYLADAQDEAQIYFRSEELLVFLREWTCPPQLSFFHCVETLTSDLAEEGHLGQVDVDLTRAWLADLVRVGYKGPRRIKTPWHYPLDRQEEGEITGNQSMKECINRPLLPKLFPKYNETYVYFYPVEQQAPLLQATVLQPMPKVPRHVSMATEICPYPLSVSNLNFLADASNGMTFFDDILLLITFNYPGYYDNIRYLEAAYRPAFANIVYCGSNRINFQAATNFTSYMQGISFIEADVSCGCMIYSCMLEAMRAGYNVTGYLHISDDVLINPWRFVGMNKSRVWMTKAHHKALDIQKQDNWGWWVLPIGKKSYEKVVEDILASPHPPAIMSWQQMARSVSRVAHGQGKIMRGLVDVYYIPRRLQHQVIWYLSKFQERFLFLEVALPVLFYGLEVESNIEDIKGKSLKTASERKKDIWKFFDTNTHYLHPVKLTKKSTTQRFCSLFMAADMTELHGHLQNKTFTAQYQNEP